MRGPLTLRSPRQLTTGCFVRQAERSLMHRFNIAHGLLETAMLRGRGNAELAAIAVWLRLSATRLLTWNRSYNIKPREISAAQARL